MCGWDPPTVRHLHPSPPSPVRAVWGRGHPVGRWDRCVRSRPSHAAAATPESPESGAEPFGDRGARWEGGVYVCIWDIFFEPPPPKPKKLGFRWGGWLRGVRTKNSSGVL